MGNPKSSVLILALVLIYLTTVEVECRIHKVKSRRNQTQSYNYYNAQSSSSNNVGLYQAQSQHPVHVPPVDGVKPQFLFFPSTSPLSKKSDADIYRREDTDSDSESSSTSIISSLKARFGAKFGKDAQNKEDGQGNGMPPDVFARIGSILGILGLGILFIAEVSSSFSAPFLIPFLMVPLAMIVILRLAYDNMIGVPNIEMWM